MVCEEFLGVQRQRLLRVEVLDDLVADEQVPTTVEVESVFKDEFFEPLTSDHSENVDHIYAGVSSRFFAQLHVALS